MSYILVIIWLVGLVVYPAIKTHNNEKMLQKMNGYVNVFQLEIRKRNTKRWIIFCVMWSLFLMEVARLIELHIIDRDIIIVLCVCVLLYILCGLEHTMLPMKGYLKAKEMIQSINQERFYQIDADIWYSSNWIFIVGFFFPKSVVTGFRLYWNTVYVYTITGEMYRCGMPWITAERHVKEISTKLEKLENTLFISEMVKLSFKNNKIELHDYSNPELFQEYMKTHTTTELITDRDLLRSVVAEAQKKN